VSNGTAVLGLGDIGPAAALPVMEGKCLIFKAFAGVDAFPIALDTKNVDEIVRTVKAISPIFGGINLEDISAPRCFEIEERLQAELDIPVFHDDQHGTAVVTLAALLNALKVVNKKLNDVKIVFTGAGASAIATAKLMMLEGARNIVACDRAGALLIFDEVMTGMGRTGKLFASLHWDVVPDILVLAKALGGGMPLGAFVSRPEIMKTLSENPPLSHVTTFGGHPVCCAAGLAALDFLLENKLPERAERLGQYLMNQLKKFSDIGGVKDVRGKGLLIGFELETAKQTERFVTHCRDAGLILGWTLHSNTVIRLAPPLIITEQEIDQGLEVMREAL